MVNLNEVARRAGVSVSSVSRVLRDDPSARIGVETRSRILSAAHELGYQPNHSARALRLARTSTIALVLPDLTNVLFTDLLRGVEEAAHARDFTVVLGHAEGMQPGGALISRMIERSRVDGVLVHPGDVVDAAGLCSLIASGVPAVLIHAEYGDAISSAIVDDTAAGEVAAQHLIELGHRRIAVIAGAPGSETSERRVAGVERALARTGLILDPALVAMVGYTPDDGRRGIRELLAQPVPPTAIVVANLNAGLGALQEAVGRGVRVPDDLSLVAIHDAWIAEITAPQLTTVALPLLKLGAVAFEALHALITTGQSAQTVVSEPAPRVMVRGSTGPTRA